MPFFLSKEALQQRQKEKELERQHQAQLREQQEREVAEQLRRAELAKNKYCEWYSEQVENFVKELRSKDFNATWGFEVEPKLDFHYGFGGKQAGYKYVFDVPPLEGLAFDVNSKQMLYFKCPTGFYDKFDEPNALLKFDYVFIPFTSIFRAHVEVDSQTTVSTLTSKQNVVGRSIVGGLLGGDAGAIIAGTTGKDVSVSKTDNVSKKIVLTIQTIHPEFPIISFEFEKTWDETSKVSKKSIGDTMHGTFSDSKKHVSFKETPLQRKCNTTVDYRFERYYKESSAVSHMESILNRINTYVMKIESIIQQCNVEVHSANTTPNIDIVAEIKKLAELKEQGIITEEEFVKLKAKYF